MKYAKLTLVALFSTSAAFFVACASGNDSSSVGGLGAGTTTGTGGGTASGGGTGNSSGSTTGNASSSSTSTSSSGSTGTTSSGTSGAGCIGTCNIDADCQNTCNPPSSGIYCCATSMSQCYLENASACPGGSASSSSGGNTGT